MLPPPQILCTFSEAKVLRKLPALAVSTSFLPIRFESQFSLTSEPNSLGKLLWRVLPMMHFPKFSGHFTSLTLVDCSKITTPFLWLSCPTLSLGYPVISLNISPQFTSLDCLSRPMLKNFSRIPSMHFSSNTFTLGNLI